jgi:hypothetical protein
MAFPLVFSTVAIDGRRSPDGGLADNVPIFPLINVHCEKIYVVHLRPDPQVRIPRFLGCAHSLHKPDELILSLWDIDFMRRKAGLPGCELLFDHGWLSTKFVHIYPEKRLGFPILSTIFFSPKSSQRLIDMGYRDASEILKATSEHSSQTEGS